MHSLAFVPGDLEDQRPEVKLFKRVGDKVAGHTLSPVCRWHHYLRQLPWGGAGRGGLSGQGHSSVWFHFEVTASHPVVGNSSLPRCLASPASLLMSEKMSCCGLIFNKTQSLAEARGSLCYEPVTSWPYSSVCSTQGR